MTTADAELKAAWAALGIECPPTEDELPHSDGMPIESERHFSQSNLLLLPLRAHWAGRNDVYAAANMFVYFSLAQVRNQDFRGPDFFAVVGVNSRERKSWVVWQEGKGPDVVVELLSDSTRHLDKGEKMLAYQDRLRVPEYFWYDPFSGEFSGFRLDSGRYRPIEPDPDGNLVSESLGLRLVRWRGAYEDIVADWIRWAALDGTPLPTAEEAATAARQEADAARQEADAARQRAEALEAELARLRARFDTSP